MSQLEYYKIFNVKINIVTLDSAIQFILNYNFNKPGYICLPAVDLLLHAVKNPSVMSYLNNSTATFPDGKPIELYAKMNGYKNISTVSGYWLIKYLLNTNLTHYFYGTNVSTLNKMKQTFIKTNYNESKIIGYKSPPYLTLGTIQNNLDVLRDIESINSFKPDIIWIGLSSPKQDELMHFFHNQLEHGLMIGVGAVFDYIANPNKFSPEWMKRLSIRWIYRLAQNPIRIGKRMFFGIPYFFYLIIKEFFQKK